MLQGALAFGLVACGSSSEAERFIGTWRYNADAANMSDCGSIDLTNQEFGMIADSSVADLEMLEPTCDFLFDVTGNTATARATSAQCRETLVGSGCPVVFADVTHNPFTLTLDGAMLVVEDHWSGTVGSSGCSARLCSGVLMGTASKLD